MTTTIDEASAFRPRLEAAGRAVLDARAALEDRTRMRDELVIEAVDAGLQQRTVAAWVGISQTRVIAILGATTAVPAPRDGA